LLYRLEYLRRIEFPVGKTNVEGIPCHLVEVRTLLIPADSLKLKMLPKIYSILPLYEYKGSY